MLTLYKDRGQTGSLQLVFNSHKNKQAFLLVTPGRNLNYYVAFFCGDWLMPLFTIHMDYFPERYSIGIMQQVCS